ncbi:hypothetical protein [Conexibacter woesei]|uniref:hypothetical protein n=1 Tax=Conexibacter woesei TaxID=191495 RepID=UPI000413A4F4|nr:hypothetical protein [Conexibacter woesei]
MTTPFLKQVRRLARSPEGKRVADEAQRLAHDPRVKARIDEARRRVAHPRSPGTSRRPA